MKESRNRTGPTISGLIRKHLSEIEKRMIEGESRDQILDWLKEETGREIERTTFFTLFYRARKWAEKEQMKVARIAALSVPASPIVATQQSTLTKTQPPKKKPKKHVERAADKPEVRHENVLPENATGQQRLRVALAIGKKPQSSIGRKTTGSPSI